MHTDYVCPDCGMAFATLSVPECPKCGGQLTGLFRDEIHVVDVAHNNETWPTAERKIRDAVAFALKNRCKGLKVIHGYGSRRGHTAILRSKALPLLRRIAETYDGRLTPDQGNPGAHIVYFNRVSA